MSALLKNENNLKIQIIGQKKFPLEINTSVELNGSPIERSRLASIPAFGLICALVSAFFGSLQSVIVKLLTHLHPIEILLIRFIIQFIVYSIVSIIKQHEFLGPKGTRLMLALRCIAGAVSLSSIYVALRLMPISDATTIHYSAPIFVIIMAYFVYKEPLSALQIMTVLLTVCGITFIAKPEFLFGTESETIHEHRLEGTVLATIAGITFAVSQIAMQKIKSIPLAINVMWFSATCVLSSLAILYAFDALVWPTGWQTWSLLSAAGIFGVCELFFLVTAFRYENAGPISVTITFNIVLTVIWGLTLLSEQFEWTSITGVAIVVSCIAIQGLHKCKTENPKQFAHIFDKLFCVNIVMESDTKNSEKSQALINA